MADEKQNPPCKSDDPDINPLIRLAVLEEKVMAATKRAAAVSAAVAIVLSTILSFALHLAMLWLRGVPVP